MLRRRIKQYKIYICQDIKKWGFYTGKPTIGLNREIDCEQ
jgi:hypothetical protein